MTLRTKTSASPRELRLNCVPKVFPRVYLGLAVIAVGLMLSVSSAFAATWYVSANVASSGNGQSWANAWKSTSNIQWSSISAGDTIFMDGGTSGLSYSSFGTISVSGTSANYITIARSTEAGRDGIVTIATPITITGSYIKFDGGEYKQVSGNTYRCGIVFTCSGNAFVGSIPSGAAVATTGQRPWFRYCYFNGTYGAGSGHSCGVNNSTGFILDHCWFYQSNYEDQWVYAASAAGGSVSITNTVFQDNNKPNRSDTAHRDVANPWTGSGGWNLYIVGCILFDTPGHASDQPQGDEFLLQVGYSGSATPLNEVIAINNVCYNTARFIAFGSSNSGVNKFALYNNTIKSVINGDSYGVTGLSYTSANNLGNSSNPGYVNATNPLGADGIPFTADDGFNLTAGSSAINAGSSVGVSVDIRGNARSGNPDLGAYEYGSSGQAMSVSAGADGSVTLPANTVTLVGSVSNATNGTPSLSWTLVSGPAAVTFSAPGSATTTATFTTAGSYTLRLTATAGSLSASDDVVVTVNPAPTLTANAGADKSITLPTNSTTLVGSVVNPLGGTLNVSWSLVSGPGTVTFGSPSAVTTTATFTSAGTYTLRLTATVSLVTVSDNVVVIVNPAPPVFGLSFQAESGTIAAPFVVSGGSISQASETDVTSGGRASYLFSVPTNGDYVITMVVNAPSEAKNSLYVNIDGEPQDPSMIWHIPVTSGAESRTVSWQGSGTYDNPQFVPKVFTLSAGTHQLVVRGREAGVLMDSISIAAPAQNPPAPPANLRVTSN